MSSFIPAQIPTSTARRTIRLQPVTEDKGASSALVGAALTVAAVVASVLAFAAI